MEVDTDQLEVLVRTALTVSGTREVKNAIGRVVKELGFKWASNGCDVADETAEFMWDGSAWDDDEEGWTMHQPLILESEWGSERDVWNDFQKLILGRAQLRVMVFWTRDEGRATQIFGRLEAGAKKSGPSQLGDRYLLASWIEGNKHFSFHGFQV